MESVSVAEAKAHLSQILNRIESGREVLITRRGRAVARISPVDGVKKPLDLESLAAFRAQQPMQKVPSVRVIRQMRDEGY